MRRPAETDISRLFINGFDHLCWRTEFKPGDVFFPIDTRFVKSILENVLCFSRMDVSNFLSLVDIQIVTLVILEILGTNNSRLPFYHDSAEDCKW